MGHLTNRLAQPIHRHVSAADERLGVRLTIGLIATFIAAGGFLLLLVLVQSEWAPLRELDTEAAAGFNRLAAQDSSLVFVFELASTIFAPEVFRVAATALAVWYLIRRERRHAVWLLATIWGAALLGLALKELVGRARPVVADPVSSAPGMSFPSGHALGATVGCGLLLLVVLRYLNRPARVLVTVIAIAIVLVTALARVGLGVHYVSDVSAGIALGVVWLAVTTWAYVTWRRETGQPVAAPAEVGAEEHEPARPPATTSKE